MLLKSELRRIAHARLADAEALLLMDRYDGAVYLGGYVVEIGLKTRVCKTLKWDGFPEKSREFDGLQSFKTHSLDNLLHRSGIENKVKNNYFTEWSVVRIWNAEDRYRQVGAITRIDADRAEALPYVVKKVQSILTKDEVLRLSGVILLRNTYFINDSDEVPYKFEETALIYTEWL